MGYTVELNQIFRAASEAAGGRLPASAEAERAIFDPAQLASSMPLTRRWRRIENAISAPDARIASNSRANGT